MILFNGSFNLNGVTLLGSGNWTGGTLGSGNGLTIVSNAVLNISGGNAKTLSGGSINAGVMNWSGSGYLQLINSGGHPQSGLGNYTINYVDGALTISPAALTIVADSRRKTFGETVTFSGAEFTSLGLLNSETVGTVVLTSAGASAAASLGTYPIFVGGATGGTFSASNYKITYLNGQLIVDSQPALEIRLLDKNVIVSWSTNAIGFALQASTNLFSTNLWSAVTNVIEIIDGQNVVTNLPVDPSVFFRLKR